MKFLNICSDNQLLLVRGVYLRMLGFEVVDVLGAARAVALLQSGEDFAMAVLCHTLTAPEKLEIEGCVRSACGQTLELYLAESPVTCGMSVEATTEFHALMRTMAAYDLVGEPDSVHTYAEYLGRQWHDSLAVN